VAKILIGKVERVVNQGAGPASKAVFQSFYFQPASRRHCRHSALAFLFVGESVILKAVA